MKKIYKKIKPWFFFPSNICVTEKVLLCHKRTVFLSLLYSEPRSDMHWVWGGGEKAVWVTLCIPEIRRLRNSRILPDLHKQFLSCVSSADERNSFPQKTNVSYYHLAEIHYGYKYLKVKLVFIYLISWGRIANSC